MPAPGRPSRPLRTAGKNVSVLTGAHVLCRVLHLVLIAVIGRTLGVEGIGGYAVAAAIALMVLFATDLGISPRLVREMAANPEAGPQEFARGLGAKLLITLIVCALAAASLAVLPLEPWVLELCALMVIAAAIESFSGLTNAVCQAHERMEFEAIGALAQSVTFVGLSIWSLAQGLPVAGLKP